MCFFFFSAVASLFIIFLRAPEKIGTLDPPSPPTLTPLCSTRLFGVYGGAEADDAKVSLPQQEQFSEGSASTWRETWKKTWKKNRVEAGTRKRDGKIYKKKTKNKTNEGFIFWTVIWGRSRCRERRRSRSSCWTSAAGGGHSGGTRPGRSPLGRRLARFHSSGRSVSGHGRLSRATPSSQAWGKKKKRKKKEKQWTKRKRTEEEKLRK